MTELQNQIDDTIKEYKERIVAFGQVPIGTKPWEEDDNGVMYCNSLLEQLEWLEAGGLERKAKAFKPDIEDMTTVLKKVVLFGNNPHSLSIGYVAALRELARNAEQVLGVTQ